jgi:hypothetical protein
MVTFTFVHLKQSSCACCKGEDKGGSSQQANEQGRSEKESFLIKHYNDKDTTMSTPPATSPLSSTQQDGATDATVS